MARPRFEKVPQERRQSIIEAAAREFGQHGYEQASLNRILEAAELSKGSAYYYFDDKADVFFTVVMAARAALTAGATTEIEALTARDFWKRARSEYVRQMLIFRRHRWIMDAGRAAWTLPEHLRQEGPLAELFKLGRARLLRFIVHGRKLGVVRDDLPDELALSLTLAVDRAFDTWLLKHLDTLDDEGIRKHAELLVDTLRRLYAPA